MTDVGFLGTRPRYEAEADLRRELEVADFLSARWGARHSKLPLQYRLDFYFSGPHPIFIEIKCRTCRATDHPYYILSAAKLMSALHLADTFNARAAFVFAFTDGEVRIIDARHVDRRLIMHGRRDRGDAQDIEPCVKIDPKTMYILREAA